MIPDNMTAMMISATKDVIMGPSGMLLFVVSASLQPSAAIHCLPSTPYHAAPAIQLATAAIKIAR